MIRRDCDQCGTVYEAQTARSRFCSGACRARASRENQPAEWVVRDVDLGDFGSLVDATRALNEAIEAQNEDVDEGLRLKMARALTLAAELDAKPGNPGLQNAFHRLEDDLRAALPTPTDREWDELVAWLKADPV